MLEKEIFKKLFDECHNGIAVYKVINNGENFIIKYFNKKAEEIENVNKKNIIGEKITDIFPGVKEFGLMKAFKRVYSTSVSEHFPLKYYKDERLEGYRENFIYKIMDDYIVAIFNDKTEQMKMSERLRKSEEKFRTIFESAPISIWVEDFSGVFNDIEKKVSSNNVDRIREYLEKDGVIEEIGKKIKIKDVNPNTVSMYKADNKKELIGSLNKVITKETSELLKKEIITLLNGEKYFEGETINKDLNGNLINILLTMAVSEEDKNFENVIVTNMDITKIKNMEKKLRYRAVRDGLSGLYNHEKILDLLSKEIERKKRYNMKLSIVMCDVDDFKLINDNYGHQKGDEIIIKISDIFKKNLREIDYAGRYGGDEFLIILPGTTITGANFVCKRIREEIKNLNVTLSFGIIEHDNEDLASFIKKADKLMYEAKKHGKDVIVK